MDTRVLQLITAFENNGWKLEGPDDIQMAWWFDDMLLLISTWRPAGTKLYITLLTDPQHSNEKIVWAVNISFTMPVQNNFNTIEQITLNDIKRTDLNALATKINTAALHKK
jgi:hypothetical protein